MGHVKGGGTQVADVCKRKIQRHFPNIFGQKSGGAPPGAVDINLTSLPKLYESPGSWEVSKTQFGIGILMQVAMSKGGYTSCRFWVVKNTRMFSKHIRPKRSLNTRSGHSKLPKLHNCLLYTSPSPRDGLLSRMPSSA